MGTRITILYRGKLHKFRQLAEGESVNEFRARAVCAVEMEEGAEYHAWEETAHGVTLSGPVSVHSWGMHCVYHRYAPDHRLPGLFRLTSERPPRVEAL